MTETTDPDAAQFAETDRIAALDVEMGDAPPPSHDIDQERRVAVYDLLEENRFRPVAPEAEAAPPGPYRLRLICEDRRIVFELSGAASDGAATDGATADGVTADAPPPPLRFRLPLAPLKTLLADYFALCGSYFDAVKRLAPAQIEAIDQDRRALHDDASTRLREVLAPHVVMDQRTSRRLFTVLCAVQSTRLGGL